MRLGLVYLSLPAAFALTQMILRGTLFGWWLIGSFVRWFVGLLICWLIDWLAGWLVDCWSPDCFLFDKCLLASLSWFTLLRYFAVHIKGRIVLPFSEGLKMLVNWDGGPFYWFVGIRNKMQTVTNSVQNPDQCMVYAIVSQQPCTVL